MNALLWTLQGLLAAVFTASGVAKISQPKDRLIASGQTGVTPFPLLVIRVTAFCELLGAVGILVPRLVGVAEFLTPAASGGFSRRKIPSWRAPSPRTRIFANPATSR
jgi:uncharacterized membrane protein